MRKHLSHTVIAHLIDQVPIFITDCRNHLKGCHASHVRLTCNEAKRGYAQDGTTKESEEDAELSIGLQVLAGEKYERDRISRP